MVARRLLTAFIAALLISALFTWWIARKVMANSRNVGPVFHKRWIVTVTKDVPAGEVLGTSILKLQEWSTSQELAGTFKRIDGVTGHATLVSLKAGDTVLAHDLAPVEAGSGLTTRLPIGSRALTIRANDIGEDTSFLLPGSLVDVLATYRSASSSEFLAATVLQNVRVLAVGISTDPNVVEPKTTATLPSITLLVSPEDAQRLTLFTSLGKIVFVLRNGVDREIVSNLAVSNSPTSGLPASTPTNTPVTRIPEPVSTTPLLQGPRFTVETIAGSKTTEESFGAVQR